MRSVETRESVYGEGRRGARRAGCGGGRGARGAVEGAHIDRLALHRSVRRGGRRERACDALSLIWPALGRSWPPAAAGGG